MAKIVEDAAGKAPKSKKAKTENPETAAEGPPEGSKEERKVLETENMKQAAAPLREPREPGKIPTLAKIMSDGEPRARKDLIAALTAACGGSAASSASIVSVALGFGVAAGFVSKGGKEYALTARETA